MHGVKSFSASVHDLMDAWIISKDGADAADIYQAAMRPLQPNVILAVIDCRFSSVEAFSAEFVRRYSVTTKVLDILSLQEPFDFRSFPDQEYLKHTAIPVLTEVLTQKRPSLSKGSTVLGSCKIFYERLLVPQKSETGRSEWCIVFSRIDLLLPEVSGFKTDGIDLSILQLLTEGAAQKEIGLRLELSPRTIEHRIERLKARIGAKNLQHLVALWIASRL
ncbi:MULTISPECIES: helix-turn-helix transcriptional regulator [unclassified Shinella]|uniref:response regulator transcription factor n=1 Tax=unclassified Shinella TaxID=2643062 RepID=UPI00225D191D|nr:MULTISPECIES: helix-turn-helix transcriptional regulator [unclassified Shinella]MCO5138890.1 helix-turn-helix transcriptional regulator [Shinella sp.]MDC7255729.1 helix-turn-helix transcriptional regulator [Shinella sp. YE25]CAI0338546.1 HTH luxR-type domain-containing protein [Rhizobiaceae bacterium]CAK7256989.1 HTH luxR-type domain-containing protein [Shinella sp. WSC3-e]